MQTGTPQPYEFEFIPRAEAARKNDEEEEANGFEDSFVRAFHALLQAKGLVHVFGLLKLPPPGASPTFEATIGRVSVTFPGDDMNKGVGAMWRFEEDGTGICARVCSQCKDFGTC